MLDHTSRLRQFLSSRQLQPNFKQLTADASTREYFRILDNDHSVIACVYPEPFKIREQTYIEVTELFLAAGLPVAKILDVDELQGIILIEDLGDRILREELECSDETRRNELIDSSIRLIARIQAASQLAIERQSVVSRLKFDVEKLLWELNFFREHYFTTYRKRPLPADVDDALIDEFTKIAGWLASRADVLCHRDFHAANLMLRGNDELFIIDHQDARFGSASYDLVSLLLDRITELPSSEWLIEKQRLLLELRTGLGLPEIDEAAFAEEFRVQSIQRCLKAVGTFSFQATLRGKTYFIPYIGPMLYIVLRSLKNTDDLPALRSVLEAETR
ncbi:aminoglycoside phosphotransferase family protein [Leptolyngbya sp. 7M]|uniref:aminoglycoside phosphotransferase family protein n=1 Tax=Leptolyngbya sp. 7M TaxID=2812896 RepID=UPI001B8B3C90|nr:phosphotransferase [Leptolyngbya sp. 7M]QYO66733.1 phosphotransferase [Leptolyngbya sp. 7M]